MFRIFVLLVCVLTIDGRQFRIDYSYYDEVHGWMKLQRVPARWHEARLRCQLEGAVLASPLNSQLLSTMKTVMQGTTCGVFTGISAIVSKGDYMSIEGVPLSKIPASWAPDEPDNYEDSESCLIALRNGTLADVNCTEPHPYICYKKNTDTVPTPNPCGTVDPEYKIDIRTNSCYKFHPEGRTYSRAFMTCTAEGGYLAIINSENEAQILRELFAKYPVNLIQAPNKNNFFIGFHDWGEKGSWLNVHGQTLQEAGYATWASGQPDNATLPAFGGQSCGTATRAAQLDDLWCEYFLPFVCEKSPGSLVDETQLEHEPR